LINTRLLTKYVIKDLTGQAQPRSDAQKAHVDWPHAEPAVLSFSPSDCGLAFNRTPSRLA